MKRKSFLFGLTLITLVFVGCQKEDTSLNDVKSVSQDANFQSLKNRVTLFKEKLSSSFKSDEKMNIDSAVWYCEAAINLTYSTGCDNQNCIEGIISREVTPDSNGDLSLSEVSEVYNVILRDISQTYYGNQADGFGYVDVYTRTNVDGKTEMVGEYSINKAVSRWVLPYRDGFLDDGTDDWMSVDRLGKCDGTFDGHDAASELTRRYMDHRIGYFTPCTYVDAHHKECEARASLWYSSDGAVVVCIPGEELQYYYEEVIPNLISNNLLTISTPGVICHRIKVYVVNEYPGGKRIAYHAMESRYGRRVPITLSQQADIPIF